jgi:hypothetical protein
MDGTDLVAFVASAGVLNEYAANDECLRNLLSIISQSPEYWQDCDDISIMQRPVPAPEIARIYRVRLELIPDEEQLSCEEGKQARRLRIATQQIVEYCAGHPDANIVTMSFNCSRYSYDVFCGITDQGLDAICVLMTKPVPAYATRRHPDHRA